ncbi:MAG TPA: glycosyltransferase [Opitutus sp.]|nr:glycosyltransferase [Opitutus sp.]
MNPRRGILLACDTLPGNPWDRDRLPAIRRALEGRAHCIRDIYEFDSASEAHALHRTKAVGFFTNEKLRDLNERFYRHVVASGCKIVVLATVDNYAQFLRPETIARLRAEGFFTVGILGDDEFTWRRNRLYVFLFDRVVAYVKRWADYYNSLRPGCCHCLPNSCFFTERDFSALQVPEAGKAHDVGLFGSVFPARRRVVEHLVDAGLKVSLFGGAGWRKIRKLRPFHRGFVASADFDATVRRCRIVLATLEDHLTGALHMNTKIWEAVRNGQMCIATRYAPLIEDYGLVEDEDIVLYDSAEDLVAKARHYLAHPAERRRIAENAFRKVSARFDYAEMYRVFFDWVEREAAESDRPAAALNAATPQITLAGKPASTDEAAQFPCLRISPKEIRARGARERLTAGIRTPYVIVTGGESSYSPFLHTLLAHFPDEVSGGAVRLRSAGSGGTGVDTLLWEMNVFLRRYVDGSAIDRLYVLAAAEGFSGMPLANTGPGAPPASPLARVMWRILRALRRRWDKASPPSASTTHA